MVIAFFGVASIMNLLVVEKTKEIGMLMAMGGHKIEYQKYFPGGKQPPGAHWSTLGSIFGLAGVLALGKVPFEIAAGGRDITTLPLILNPWDFCC